MTTARDQSTLGRAIQDRFPRYYRYFSTESVQLSRPFDPQPQSPARQCRGRRWHQDRLHPCVGLQSRDLDAPRQSPSGRRGVGRPQRRFARRHHAQPARRKSGKGRDQAYRCRDHRAQSCGRQHRCRGSRSRASRPTQTVQAPRLPFSRSRAEPSRGAGAALHRLHDRSIFAAAAAAVPPPQAKPEPAPLTNGVIQAQPIAAIPGSSEPMKPVKVKTVQVKAGQVKLAVGRCGPASHARSPAPYPPARPDVPETSSAIVAKAEPTRLKSTRAEIQQG